MSILKHYPFHELDFITREDGIKYIIDYLEQPSENTLEEIHNNTKPYLRDYFQEYFWIVIKDIDFRNGDINRRLYQIIDCCFILSWWDIKEYIYDIDSGELKEGRVKLFNNQIKLIKEAVNESQYWQAYIDIFNNRLKDFIIEISTNIPGYTEISERLNKVDAKKTKVKKDLEVTGFRLKWNTITSQVDRLHDYLLEEGMIDDRTINKAVRNAFSGKAITGQITWSGDITQLKYFIHKLFRRDMLIEKKTNWVKVNQLFNVNDVELEKDQLNDTSYPAEVHKEPINRIAEKLHTIGVNMNTLDF